MQTERAWWISREAEMVKWKDWVIDGVKCQVADMRGSFQRYRILLKIDGALLKEIRARHHRLSEAGKAGDFKKEKFPVEIGVQSSLMPEKVTLPKALTSRSSFFRVAETMVNAGLQKRASKPNEKLAELIGALRNAGLGRFEVWDDREGPKLDLTVDQIWQAALLPPVGYLRLVSEK